MGRKERFTVITKILGVCAILFSLIGFYVLFVYSENISLAIWNMVYMIFIPMGGVFNLLDFGKISYSKGAFISYALALVLRILFDITIAGEMHWVFLLMLTTAFLISFLRYCSVRKSIPTHKPSQPDSVAHVGTGVELQTCIVDNSQPNCRVGIMRESRVSGSGSAFTIYVDGIKTTTLNNGKMTRLSLSPGKHVIGFSTIGCKIKTIALELAPGSDANIMCCTTLSGIEAVLTSVDVCSLAGSSQPTQPQSGGNGCLIAIFIVILLFALGILSIKFTVFFVPIN